MHVVIFDVLVRRGVIANFTNQYAIAEVTTSYSFKGGFNRAFKGGLKRGSKRGFKRGALQRGLIRGGAFFKALLQKGCL